MYVISGFAKNLGKTTSKGSANNIYFPSCPLVYKEVTSFPSCFVRSFLPMLRLLSNSLASCFLVIRHVFHRRHNMTNQLRSHNSICLGLVTTYCECKPSNIHGKLQTNLLAGNILRKRMWVCLVRQMLWQSFCMSANLHCLPWQNKKWHSAAEKRCHTKIEDVAKVEADMNF